MEIREEIFKDIKGYEGRYQISNFGNVWSIVSQRILRPAVNQGGYQSVVLYAKNGKQKREYVHRLVALMFLDNPEGLPQVNHKDENKLNNQVNNLEWCSSKYNVNYGSRIERVAKANRKPIKLVDIQSGNEAIFDSLKDCALFLGITDSGVNKALKNGFTIKKRFKVYYNEV